MLTSSQSGSFLYVHEVAVGSAINVESMLSCVCVCCFPKKKTKVIKHLS